MNRWHPLPGGIYALVEQTPGTILLETSRPAASPFSRIFTSPLRIVRARTAAEIDALFPIIEASIEESLFLAGFFAYECGRCFEPAASSSREHAKGPDDLLAWFGVYERCYLFDHRNGAFVGNVPPVPPGQESGEPRQAPAVSLAIDQEDYSARIRQIHDWIRAGDVYQLNLTFPLEVEVSESPAELYARLQRAQPVEYGAFFHGEQGRYILSHSPELFFRLQQDGNKRHITMRPMKGTAGRGRTTAEDSNIAAWLAGDEKNRAENVMIVDLIRNDLGRISEFGSVRVEKLFEVERYPTLWQMTSTVEAELRSEVGLKDVFRALFPCGSVTGAPKIRAMQLLAEIEDSPRGVYTGSIGFFSQSESVFNVAIRTLSLAGRGATMGVGSGIVIDSDPLTEFRECQWKAQFLTRSDQPFSLVETMLWDGHYPLLDLHLDRLEDSADYFGFACDRIAIEAALLRETDALLEQQPRRVRLLLDTDGTIRIECEILSSPPEVMAQVRLAIERTDPSDPFLFHKTTRRPLYNRAFREASASGLADVLFLNTRGELTEGAASNVILEKAGKWYTPPIESGVLPGVYRRHLLQTRSNIEVCVLALSDLKSADAIYISNAVRGIRKVELLCPGTVGQVP